MIFKTKIKKGKVLIHISEPSYVKQDRFDIVFVDSDPYVKIDNIGIKSYIFDSQSLTINFYRHVDAKNGLMFSPSFINMHSEFAENCVEFFKMKDHNHYLFMIFESIFDEKKAY